MAAVECICCNLIQSNLYFLNSFDINSIEFNKMFDQNKHESSVRHEIFLYDIFHMRQTDIVTEIYFVMYNIDSLKRNIQLITVLN